MLFKLASFLLLSSCNVLRYGYIFNGPRSRSKDSKKKFGEREPIKCICAGPKMSVQSPDFQITFFPICFYILWTVSIIFIWRSVINYWGSFLIYCHNNRLCFFFSICKEKCSLNDFLGKYHHMMNYFGAFYAQQCTCYDVWYAWTLFVLLTLKSTNLFIFSMRYSI